MKGTLHHRHTGTLHHNITISRHKVVIKVTLMMDTLHFRHLSLILLRRFITVIIIMVIARMNVALSSGDAHYIGMLKSQL
ncbi:hypothetical protein KSS87_019983 [Heliosperma pusillum]|nr:hypothetical protein KSS87_019983 [Heliosperma pusillum]